MKDDYNQIQEKTRLIAQQPGRYLVESVPGSGKTELAVQVAKSLRGNKLIITLQNRCVAEFNERLKKNEVCDKAKTIHSLGFKLLKLEKRALGFKAHVSAWNASETEREFKSFAESRRDLPVTVKELWRLYKSWCAWDGSYRDNARRIGIKWKPIYSIQVKRIFNQWAEYKRKKNRVDFYDMIVLPLQILNEERVQAFVCRHTAIICDEIQDCSRMQLKLIVALMKLVPTSVLVGDRMQSIFGFSGGIGEPFEYVRSLAKTKTLHLQHSLRITREIADLAQLVMNPDYQGLEIKTTKSGAKPSIWIYDDRIAQYQDAAVEIRCLLNEGVAAKDIVIVARTNASLRMMGDVLSHYNVPYNRKLQATERQRVELVYKGFMTFLNVLVNQDERAVAEYLHAHNTELENAVIKRLAKAPPTRLSKKYKVPTAHQAGLRKCLRAVRACLSITDAMTMMRAYQNNFGKEMNKFDPNGLCRYVRSLGIDLTGIQLGDLMKALDDRECDETKTETGVELLTIHKAKGGGWKYVFVIDVYEGGIPHFKNLNSLEELRNLFVALTRSSKELFISGINQETWASTIEGIEEDGEKIVKTCGKQLEEMWLDKKGNVKKWKSDPNPNATGIVTRKTCRYIENGDALRKVADVRYIKRNEES